MEYTYIIESLSLTFGTCNHDDENSPNCHNQIPELTPNKTWA